MAARRPESVASLPAVASSAVARAVLLVVVLACVA